MSEQRGGAVVTEPVREPTASRSRAGRMRPIVLALCRTLFSAVLLWIVLPRLSWDEVRRTVAELSLPLLALAFAILLVMTFASSWRWQRICALLGARMSWLDAWRATMVGVFFDQFVFSMSGDAARVWWLTGRAPSVTHAVNGVLLDRILSILALVVMVMVALPFLASAPSVGRLLWAPLGLAVAGIAGVAVLILYKSIPLPRFPFSENLRLLSEGARLLFLDARHIGAPFALALLGQLGWPCMVAVIAAALGVHVSLAWCFLVVPTVMFVTLLPVSIGGWGVRETAMVAGLGAAGVSNVDAVLISILVGLCTIAVGLSGGIVWLFGLPQAPKADPRQDAIGR